jgi:hypothetical protein
MKRNIRTFIIFAVWIAFLIGGCIWLGGCRGPGHAPLWYDRPATAGEVRRYSDAVQGVEEKKACGTWPVGRQQLAPRNAGRDRRMEEALNKSNP